MSLGMIKNKSQEWCRGFINQLEFGYFAGCLLCLLFLVCSLISCICVRFPRSFRSRPSIPCDAVFRGLSAHPTLNDDFAGRGLLFVDGASSVFRMLRVCHRFREHETPGFVSAELLAWLQYMLEVSSHERAR